MAGLDATIERFTAHASGSAGSAERGMGEAIAVAILHISEVVAESGGAGLLAKIGDDLLHYLQDAGHRTTVDTTGRTAMETCHDVLSVVRP